MTVNWTELRARFALAGVDWRVWSAADFAAVSFLMWKRAYADDPLELRKLYELVGDTEAVAELDRQNMGQSRTIETTM